MSNNFEAILWDFDGVLMDSNPVRDLGFLEVLRGYPKEQVDELMSFHKANGGLSRYIKFRYFFETIRNEQVSEDEINIWAARFSDIMKSLLVNSSLLISETLQYVKLNSGQIPMHIVSGSDQKELRYLAASLKIERYFRSIHGSPTTKKILVREVLERENYNPQKCLLIGDSVNDFEAADANNVKFMAYNNTGILHLTTASISLK